MLIFAESWENVSLTADATARGWTIGANIIFNNTDGRNGGKAAKHGGGAGGTLSRLVNHGTSLLRSAFWFKAGAVFATEDWLLMYNNAAATQSGGIKLNTDGKLRAYSWGTTPGLVASGAINIITGNYVYIEIEALFADSGGSLKVWINGSLDINFSGDTLASGTVSVDRLTYNIKGNSDTKYVDDILIWDDSGSGLIGNLGGKAYTMSVIRPTSDVTAEFTRSTGASNFGTVDEAALSATDYNESSTVGHVDLYGCSDLSGVSSSAEILGVVVESAISNLGAGAINAKLLADIGGTTVEGSAIAVPSAVTVVQELFTTKPGGGAWTPSDVNAGRFGIKVAA
ncbi:MAG: hypothetical protein U1E42_03580 [Rhodospirillales bacterium]